MQGSVTDHAATVVCVVCQQLLRDNQDEQPAAAPIADQQEPEEVPALPGPRKAGRPKKDEAPGSRWSLATWVRQSRSDIYLETDKSHLKCAAYFCRACNRQIQFGTQTCEAKVRRHEQYKTHVEGLRKLRGDAAIQPANAGVQKPDPAGPRQECAGLLASKLVLASFVQYGQPRLLYSEHETDWLASVAFQVLPQDIAVRSTERKGFLEGLSACSACVKAANQRKLKQALAKQVFMIDLCVLSYKCIHSPAEELQSFKEELRQRDYQQQNLAGSDLDRLLRIKNNLEVCRAVTARLDTTPAWRVSSSLRKFWDAWLTRPQKHHQTSTEAEAYGCLARGMMDAVASGRAREFDLVLAARVAAGALRSDVLVESLTTSFLAKFKEGLAECRRRTTSEFANFQVLSESLATLGRHAEVDSLLRSFCVNPRSLPALSLVTERYPQPYVSLNDPPVLRESYMRGLTLLKAAGTRPHLVCDETTWAPDWSQVRRVCRNEAGELVDRIVGGAWHADPAKDMSLLDPDEHDRTNYHVRNWRNLHSTSVCLEETARGICLTSVCCHVHQAWGLQRKPWMSSPKCFTSAQKPVGDRPMVSHSMAAPIM